MHSSLLFSFLSIFQSSFHEWFSIFLLACGYSLYLVRRFYSGSISRLSTLIEAIPTALPGLRYQNQITGNWISWITCYSYSENKNGTLTPKILFCLEVCMSDQLHEFTILTIFYSYWIQRIRFLNFDFSLLIKSDLNNSDSKICFAHGVILRFYRFPTDSVSLHDSTSFTPEVLWQLIR